MDSIHNYLNSLIFCIAIKGIAVICLVLLLFKWANDFSYVILTFLICMVVIVFFILYKIYNFDQTMAKLKEDARAAPAALDSCPDYYTRDASIEDIVSCTNTFNTADGRATYVIGDTDASTSINMSNVISSASNMSDLCLNVSNYTGTPWTEYKAKCDILNQ
jgi:hypothetical protein